MINHTRVLMPLFSLTILELQTLRAVNIGISGTLKREKNT